MAIGYVGKAFVLNTVAGVNCAVPMPSVLAAGNKLYCLVGSIGSNAGAMTVPAGWTTVREQVTGTNLRVGLYSKTAVSGDAGATYTWVFPASGKNFGYSVAYSGVDPAVSELVDVSSTTDAGQGPWNVPAVSVGNGDWLITAAVGRQNPGTAVEKTWTTSDPADTARYSLGTVETPSINIAAGLWDSARALSAGPQARSLGVSAAMSQSQVWSVRLATTVVGGTPGAGDDPWTFMGMPMGVGGIPAIATFAAINASVVGAETTAPGISREDDVLVIDTSTAPAEPSGAVLVINV